MADLEVGGQGQLTDQSVVPLDEDEDTALISSESGDLESVADRAEDVRERVGREELELESFRQDIKHRKLYANRIYWFVVSWVGLVMGTVCLSGWSPGGFELSDKVLMMLIGGTTANVLGLFAIVANYLFPKTDN